MRSTMAIVLLAMAAFFGYQFFFAKPKPDQQPPAQTQSQPAAPAVCRSCRTRPTAERRRSRTGPRDHAANCGPA